MTAPLFPIRIISDDGDCQTIDSADALLDRIDAIDTATSGTNIWVRDALDRTVRLRIRAGIVELIETD